MTNSQQPSASSPAPDSAANPCPHCHQPIAGDAPGGHCPACLLRSAQEHGTPSATLPDWDTVAAAFPQLELIRVIGQGGMAVVYEARQTALNRSIALKIFSPSLRQDPAFAERFAREARILGQLRHPHIVTVYEHGQQNGIPYLLLEYIDGPNLRQAMETGRFSPEQALTIIPQICDALATAHAQGIWHRDIKPENILLDAKAQVKIADFGIARLLGDPQRNFTLTHTGHSLGTPSYMAPEQHEKPHLADHRADIYSLGVVFYELLTGELPLGRFPAPSQRAAVDAHIDQIVLKTLEKERELRQQSAEELKTELQTRPAPEQPKRKHKALIAWIAAAAFVLLLLPLSAVAWIAVLRIRNAEVQHHERTRLVAHQANTSSGVLTQTPPAPKPEAHAPAHPVASASSSNNSQSPPLSTPEAQWTAWTRQLQSYPGQHRRLRWSDIDGALQHGPKYFGFFNRIVCDPQEIESWLAGQSAEQSAPQTELQQATLRQDRLDRIGMTIFWTPEQPDQLQWLRGVAFPLQGNWDSISETQVLDTLRQGLADSATQHEFVRAQLQNKPWSQSFEGLGPSGLSAFILPGESTAPIIGVLQTTLRNRPGPRLSLTYRILQTTNGQGPIRTISHAEAEGDEAAKASNFLTAVTRYREAIERTRKPDGASTSAKPARSISLLIKLGDARIASRPSPRPGQNLPALPADALQAWRDAVIQAEISVNKNHQINHSWEERGQNPATTAPVNESLCLQLAKQWQQPNLQDIGRTDITRELSRQLLPAIAERRPIVTNILASLQDPARPNPPSDDSKRLLELLRLAAIYQLSNRPEALTPILDSLAKQPPGGDCYEAFILGFVDEWERSIPAIQAHFTKTDGAGGIQLADFWTTRKYRFPRQYLLHLHPTLAGSGMPKPEPQPTAALLPNISNATTPEAQALLERLAAINDGELLRLAAEAVEARETLQQPIALMLELRLEQTQLSAMGLGPNHPHRRGIETQLDQLRATLKDAVAQHLTQPADSSHLQLVQERINALKHLAEGLGNMGPLEAHARAQEQNLAYSNAEMLVPMFREGNLLATQMVQQGLGPKHPYRAANQARLDEITLMIQSEIERSIQLEVRNLEASKYSTTTPPQGSASEPPNTTANPPEPTPAAP